MIFLVVNIIFKSIFLLITHHSVDDIDTAIRSHPITRTYDWMMLGLVAGQHCLNLLSRVSPKLYGKSTSSNGREHGDMCSYQ